MYSKEKLQRKINRIQKKVDNIMLQHGDTPSLTHTYYGGQKLGYWQGRLSVLEELLDDTEENN